MDVPGCPSTDGVAQADFVAAHVEQRARDLLDLVVVHPPGVRADDDDADVPASESALLKPPVGSLGIPADA